MVAVKYPHILTPGQLALIKSSGKTNYAIAKEGKLNHYNFNRALKGEHEVNVATVIKIARSIGIPFEEFENI